MKNPSVVVHGNGMAALVTAAALAGEGRRVSLVCGSAATAAAVAGGDLPFAEPGLVEALAGAQRSGHLRIAGLFGEVPPAAAAGVHFLALQPDERPQADALVDALARVSGDLLLVNQVNFGVGVTDAFAARLLARRGSQPRTAAVSLPDFLRRGTALANFRRPDRVIIGTGDDWAAASLRDLLRSCIGDDVPVLVMPARDAEFTKQAVNGMLATRLSYMNDMANVADALGIDIEHVRLGVGSDDRIGSHHLHPGCGFGGTGFYQDLMSLKATLDESGAASKLVDTAIAVNEEQKELLFRKLWRHYHGQLAGRTVAIWGVAFKPDTDRVDHAPSLSVVRALLAQGVKVQVHDPKALGQLLLQVGDQPGLVACDDPWQAVTGADALLVLTEWQVYRQPDFSRLMKALRVPVLLDGRNLYDPQAVRGHGFSYYGVGRG
ncbi:MAG: UDP-glucose dehydrogenase family protein [Gammaproteobacteria bacterium]